MVSAEILKDDGKENENTNTNINTKSNSSSEKVKPIFLKDEDVFGSSMKPARSLWLTNVEIYKAIGVRVPLLSLWCLVVFVQDYMDFVNEGEFACHAKLNPAPTMTVCPTVKQVTD
jgi:hypothetical protein